MNVVIYLPRLFGGKCGETGEVWGRGWGGAEGSDSCKNLTASMTVDLQTRAYIWGAKQGWIMWERYHRASDMEAIFRIHQHLECMKSVRVHNF